ETERTDVAEESHGDDPDSTPESVQTGRTDPAAYDTDEYYTPLEVLEDARRVLGVIDLDPASCEAAQKRVQAKTFYTKENDGAHPLIPWFGKTWLNPPFSQPLATQ